MAIKEPEVTPSTDTGFEKMWQGAEKLTQTSAQRTSGPKHWWSGVVSPTGIMILAIMLVLTMLSYGIGASMVSKGSTASSASGTTSSSSSSSSDSMNMGGSSNTSASNSTANVPDATQQYGNQPAKYVLDADGAKHFTFTAKQVMWQPVKGQKVLASTLDGTVPGPMIRVNANDHVRITIINHLPQSTSMHWHGLMIPSESDGVPGIGMKPIQPGQSYTYDFTVHTVDIGTHWYHSHDNDSVQVPQGLYGMFIVDPPAGTPQPIKADVDYTAMVSELGSYYVITGKSFPDTLPINVKHGQTVHIRLVGAGQMMHPMHLHGHFFNIVAEDGHMLAQPIQKDTIQLGPGETYDLTFTAWAAPGSVYPFHCHILGHVMNPGQTGDEMGGLIVLVEYAK